MKDNYSKLITFKFGKHTYDVLKEYDKVLYFEVQEDSYIMPIDSFNLYDNQGKSLTSVNQHFFMNQLISRINLACKKGIFVSDEEIVDYLTKLKNKVESDSELSGLFKGSLMGEINEENFEKNKKSLLDYLDQNRFDTFVNYNNVSIFTGSLEKEPEVSNSNPEEIVSDVEEPLIVEESSEEAPAVVEENSEEAVQFDNLDNISVNDEPAVDVNDFFGNAQASNNGYESDFDMQDSNNFNNIFFDSNSENSIQNVENQSEPVLENPELNVNNNVTDTFYGGFSEPAVSEEVPSNVSYIDEVKNRIGDSSSVVSDFNSMSTPSAFEYQGVSTPEVSETVIPLENVEEPVLPSETENPVVSNNEVPTSASIEPDVSVSTFSTEVQNDTADKNDLSTDFVDVSDESQGKKSSVGVIIFIIILILLLVGFSYYLYNYVF